MTRSTPTGTETRAPAPAADWHASCSTCRPGGDPMSFVYLLLPVGLGFGLGAVAILRVALNAE